MSPSIGDPVVIWISVKRFTKHKEALEIVLICETAFRETAVCSCWDLDVNNPHSISLQCILLGAGPGRQIMVDGFQALRRGSPDMNTLVGLGATASFGASCVAAALPKLGWRTFFEEPAMLLGFVLLGRALEERAKLQASSDMAALQVRLSPLLCFFICTGLGMCCVLCSGLLQCHWTWFQSWRCSLRDERVSKE